MVAYTDAAKIAAYLGTTLTGAQQTQAGVVAQAASDWIDQYKGRSWQAPSPVTDEAHQIIGDRVYLSHVPVAAITTVKTRFPVYVGGSWTTLGTGQYELLSATRGELRIQGWGPGLALVTYTHTAAVPSYVALGATMIAAAWLQSTLHPESHGVSQISVGQNDVNVKYSENSHDVPPEALRVLGGRAVVIA